MNNKKTTKCGYRSTGKQEENQFFCCNICNWSFRTKKLFSLTKAKKKREAADWIGTKARSWETPCKVYPNTNYNLWPNYVCIHHFPFCLHIIKIYLYLYIYTYIHIYAAKSLEYTDFQVQCDYQLLVSLLQGKVKAPWRLDRLLQEISFFLLSLRCQIIYVVRETNMLVDSFRNFHCDASS